MVVVVLVLVLVLAVVNSDSRTRRKSLRATIEVGRDSQRHQRRQCRRHGLRRETRLQELLGHLIVPTKNLIVIAQTLRWQTLALVHPSHRAGGLAGEPAAHTHARALVLAHALALDHATPALAPDHGLARGRTLGLGLIGRDGRGGRSQRKRAGRTRSRARLLCCRRLLGGGGLEGRPRRGRREMVTLARMTMARRWTDFRGRIYSRRARRSTSKRCR